MQDYKQAFQLPDGVHYLNNAYMSPQLKKGEEAGILGIQKKRNPALIQPIDFFTASAELRKKFGQLVGSHEKETAIIPSASYGLMQAVQNIPPHAGDHIVMVGEEFPSAVYAVERWCAWHHKNLVVVAAPMTKDKKGREWNESILEHILPNTAAVVMSSVHWTDGTRFDLKQIGQACNACQAWFIVDGTQSVGAVPIDVHENHMDALICAGYKWLLGPYSLGMAWYGARYANGWGLEETWMNRANAENFGELTRYTSEYKEASARYNAGEFSNFILVPMLSASIQQLLDWDPAYIAQYSEYLLQPVAETLVEKGFTVEEKNYRSPHLLGLGLPPHLDKNKLVNRLKEKNIYVSVRGEALRISAHVYNTQQDTDALLKVITSL